MLESLVMDNVCDVLEVKTDGDSIDPAVQQWGQFKGGQDQRSVVCFIQTDARHFYSKEDNRVRYHNKILFSF